MKRYPLFPAVLAALLVLRACVPAPAAVSTSPGQATLVNGFIFIGDSLSDYRTGVKPTGPNTDWPHVLLRQTNYLWHSLSTNAAAGGTTASQWNSSYYTTYVHPFSRLFNGGRYYGFVLIGNNDMGDTEANITNNIAGIWTQMDTDKLHPIAITLTTNTSWNFTQLTLWTNVCRDIRSMAAARGYPLIDGMLTISNAALQEVDGVHWTAAQHTNFALYVSQNFNPSLSGLWSGSPTPNEFADPVHFAGQANFGAGLVIDGATGFGPESGRGRVLQIYHWSGSLESAGGVIASVDTGSGNASETLTIQGAPVSFSGLAANMPNMYTPGGNTARLGGTVSAQDAPVVGAGTAATNLLTYSVTANTFSATHDSIEVVASGKFSLTGQSKQLQLILGSETILDSGSQAVSNSAWVIRANIVRQAGGGQYANATLTWGQGPFSSTNATVTLSQTNTIATLLRVVGTAGVTSCITNEMLFVRWFPTP